MPATSEKQERAMHAAAEGHSTLGIPEKVGKEFVAADDSLIAAAGIAFIANGKVLLLKRGEGGDYPGHWAFPGGRQELDEIPEQAAVRECVEETGYLPVGTLRPLSFIDDGRVAFTTFGKAVAEFEPVLCDESTDWVWAEPGRYPEPLHPGVRMTLESGVLDSIDPRKMDELQIARAMAAGELPSPQHYENMVMFAIRITGTGVAYRTAVNEFVFRNPDLYLNDEFLARCNGLPVISEHPEKASLNSEEFADRVIGSVVLPYISGNEVWGISRIYDETAAGLMEKHQLSTSPTVVFRDPAVNSTVKLEDGATLLIEGKPSLLDHVAICIQGVWDKGGPPSGVSTTNVQEIQMTEEELKAKADAEAKEQAEAKAKADSEEKAKADAETMGKVMSMCDSIMKRMDSFEANFKKPDADTMPGAPMQTAADKAKADADAKEAAEAKAKADAEEADRKEEEAKAKADAEETRKKIADLESRMPKEMSDSDYAEIADAQAKADSVYSAFGDSAPRPLRGENLLGYRKRLASKLKGNSAAWKDVDLSVLDASVVAIAEAQIYADSVTAAAHPVDLPAGTLRAIEKKDENGQLVRTFVGDPDAWMGNFKSIPMKQVAIHRGNQ
jgi:8-oxo-dGTP pyrophosphatase MutT (NUDIX family)